MDTLFLDTTVKIEDVLKANRDTDRARLDGLFSAFGDRHACSFSRLEYKRVVLQNMVLLLRYLTEEKSLFAVLFRISPLSDRKKSTLLSIMGWMGIQIDNLTVEAGSGIDAQIQERMSSYIRISITAIWARFATNTTVADGLKCQRAIEEPILLKNGSFDLTVHESHCKQQTCNNAGFFAVMLPQIRTICDRLDAIVAGGGKLSPELEKSLVTMRAAMVNQNILYDYGRCLRIGDIWIHLEALKAGVKHFATTNYKESDILCPAVGLVQHNPYEMTNRR